MSGKQPHDKQVQQLDLNLLKVFETLYAEQNMSRTAELLFLTPSAVSHAMRRLRTVLQDPLFERQGNRMVPTSACYRLAPKILESLNALRSSLQQFTEFDPYGSEQHFNLAIHDALEALYVPSLFERLHQFSSLMGLSCVKLDRQHLPRQLSMGQADLAIDVALPLSSPIEHCPIANDQLVVLHRSSMAMPITPADYTHAQHIAVSNRPTGRVIEDIALQQQSINRKVVVRCQSYHTAKALLKQQNFLLTVPGSIAHALQDEQLGISEIPFALPKIAIHLYWHENTREDAAITWLRKQILATQANLLTSTSHRQLDHR